MTGFFACAVTSLVAGLFILRALRIDLNRWECICLGYLVGSAAVSTATPVLGLLSLARKGVFLALAFSALLICWRLLPWFRSLQPITWRSFSLFARALFLFAWAAYGVVYFKHALGPELSPDSAVYHLGLVNLWNHAHGISRIVDMYAALPHGMEMLFLFAFAIGRHSAAALVHFSFLLLLPVLTVLYGVRFGLSRWASMFAALVVFVTPLVGWDGSVAYNDVALAAVTFAAVYLLSIWRNTKNNGALLASALLAGFSFSVKYSAAPLIVFVIGTVLWESRRDRRALTALPAALAMMAIAPLPYLVCNAVWFGNPVAPFANSIFRNPYFHVSFENSYYRGLSHLNGITWGEIPRELTLRRNKLPVSLGPIYTLAPLALAGLFWPQGRFLLAACLATAIAYAGNKDPRFLIPALPFITLLVGITIRRFPTGRIILGALITAQILVSWPFLRRHIHEPNLPDPQLTSPSWKAAFRAEPEENYLSRFDQYAMARLIESHVPAGATIFALDGGAAQSYTTRTILDSYHSARAEEASDLLFSSENSASDTRWRWVATFPKTETRQVRITPTGTRADMWTVDEVRLLAADKAVVPSAAWHWQAFPNRWDVPLLTDGILRPRWRSWEPIRPGMNITAEASSGQPIDRLEVLSGNGPWEVKLDAGILDTYGRWIRPLSVEWKMEPAIDLRKAATDALKRRGVHYVLISATAWRAEGYHRDPGAWGMHPLVATKGATLYQID